MWTLARSEVSGDGFGKLCVLDTTAFATSFQSMSEAKSFTELLLDLALLGIAGILPECPYKRDGATPLRGQASPLLGRPLSGYGRAVDCCLRHT